MAQLLDILLSDNPQEPGDRPQKPWPWKRKGAEIPCQGLFHDELVNVRKNATFLVQDQKTRAREEKFDVDKWNDELILACTPGVFNQPDLLKHYGVPTAAEALHLAMRNQTDYIGLLNHCMELCGLGDTAPAPEEQAKNG